MLQLRHSKLGVETVAGMLPEFDFGLGETIDMLRRSVRDFCEQEIVPIAERIDQSNEYPRNLRPLLGQSLIHI